MTTNNRIRMTVKELHEKLGILVEEGIGHYKVLTKDKSEVRYSGFADYFARGIKVEDMYGLVSLEHDHNEY